MSPSSQDVPEGSGVPAWQDPAPSQVSKPLQNRPSSHDVPAVTGSFMQPPTGSQLSKVQELKSSHCSGELDWHDPAPSQVSAPLHTSPSSHDVPAVTGVKTQTPALQLSVVQVLESLQSVSTTHEGTDGYSAGPANTT